MSRVARCAVTIVLLLAGPISATGDSRLSLVPWQVLAPGAEVSTPLVLYWIPVDPDEVRRSDLLSSEELTRAAARCVAMRIVRADDRQRLERLGVGEALPVVLLADAKGNVVTRIEAVSRANVEAAVREELSRHATAADSTLDSAQRIAASGDKPTAIMLYRSVADDPCVQPRQARVAKRALRRLVKK